MTCFNKQTNTCFYTGMGNISIVNTTDNNDENSSENNKSKTSSKSQGIGLSDNDITIKSNDYVASGVLGDINFDDEVTYETLSQEFKNSTTNKISKLHEYKKVITITLLELATYELFRYKLMNIIFSNCIVYVKVIYKPNLVRMVGRQVLFASYSEEVVEDFRYYITGELMLQLESYSFDKSRVNHIIVTVVPIKVNLLNKYKVDSSKRKEIREFIDTNFFSKTIIPITVNPVILGGELPKEVRDDKIVDIVYFITRNGVVLDRVSLKKNIFLDNKLSNLSPKFKFYYVILNNRPYILGLHYLTKDSVRKIRLSLSGLFLEDLVDSVLSNGNIKRVKNNNVLIIKKDRVIEYYKLMKLLPISKHNIKSISATENPNIGVLDFETFKSKEGNYKIYAGGFKSYLDNKLTMYYIEDVKYPDLCVLNLVDELLRSKYSKTTFYCHNLGGFDVIFLIKVLVDYNENSHNLDKLGNIVKYDLSFMFRDSRILAITIGKEGRKLTIKDSYGILNSSLRDLAKSYDCNFNKSYFPYKFSTEDNLFYVGNTPIKSNYEGISQYDYDKLCSDNWSFKQETLKYLELDLLTLYEVLSKANKQLFLDYDIDMTKSHTISGLALKLFLLKYYKNNIPNISKKSVYTELKQGYYGGITEVYKPYGKNLFYYDINSLYPFASLNDMPGLKCKNILITNSKDMPFGFLYCVIDTTNVKQQYLGLLPLRCARSKGLIFPLGKWSGWYFSEELKFARENGYKITFIKGYEFSRESEMFDSYVKDIYNQKVNASNSVRKAISKSLLNNLLGRFGINLEKYHTDIVDEEGFNNISIVREVKGVTNIGNMNLVSYSSSIDYDNINKLDLDINEVLKHNKDSEMKGQSATSVVISAAVTAYARIIMCKHKIDILNRGGELYYSDTDSIVTNIELPDDLVSTSELGKFKLEHKVKQGIFISGKTYCLITQDDKFIKRAKGVDTETLSYNDYVNLLNKNNVAVFKKNSIKDYTAGSVKIETLDVMLNADSYEKRTKLYANENWVNTKPIYINTIDKCLI